jgi:hypothetical protein
MITLVGDRVHRFGWRSDIILTRIREVVESILIYIYIFRSKTVKHNKCILEYIFVVFDGLNPNYIYLEHTTECTQ